MSSLHHQIVRSTGIIHLSPIFLALFCCTNMKCSYPPEKVSAVRSHKRAEKYFSGRGNVFWLDSLDHRREDLKFFREKGLRKGR